MTRSGDRGHGVGGRVDDDGFAQHALAVVGDDDEPVRTDERLPGHAAGVREPGARHGRHRRRRPAHGPDRRQDRIGNEE